MHGLEGVHAGRAFVLTNGTTDLHPHTHAHICEATSQTISLVDITPEKKSPSAVARGSHWALWAKILLEYRYMSRLFGDLGIPKSGY